MFKLIIFFVLFEICRLSSIISSPLFSFLPFDPICLMKNKYFFIERKKKANNNKYKNKPTNEENNNSEKKPYWLRKQMTRACASCKNQILFRPIDIYFLFLQFSLLLWRYVFCILCYVIVLLVLKSFNKVVLCEFM